MKTQITRMRRRLLLSLSMGILAGSTALMSVGCAGNKTAAAVPPQAPAAAPQGASPNPALEAQQQNAQQQALMMAQSDAHRAPMQQRKSQ